MTSICFTAYEQRRFLAGEQRGRVLGDVFPLGHPYQNVHSAPGPWQAAQNRVPVSATGPEIWVLGSSPHSARLAAQPGRPYAFALQFGDADVDTTMRLYREEFQPSELLAEPHTLVSVSAAISDDPAEAKRQASTSAMAILRMFKREGYLLLPPNEVEEYSATTQERTKADEVTLVVVGHSAEQDQHGLELLADHYNLPHKIAPQQRRAVILPDQTD